MFHQRGTRLKKLGVAVCNQLAADLGFSGGIPSPADCDRLWSTAFHGPESDFKLNYLRGLCFSKWTAGGDRDALLKTALEKFSKAELTCRDTNGRLFDLSSRPLADQRVVSRARQIISSILGRFSLDELPQCCDFGPGASTSLTRATAARRVKWVRSTHVTERALPYAVAFAQWAGLTREWFPVQLIEQDPCSLVNPTLQLHVSPQFTIVAGNRITTVPKNRKTDRCIAIEPDWNMFLQKGLGRMIRRRLQRRAKLLSPAAQEEHKILARFGSATGGLATIDLSSASDTIALSLCFELLPREWFNVISDLRSPVGELPDGSVVTYEKVSSMGNGFTFELETLLFYAIVRATCESMDGNSTHTVSCYGDDIICPSRLALPVIEQLMFFGFSINPEKTFVTGPFRESCGGHYYDGEEVPVFFVKDPPECMADLVVLGNKMSTWNSVTNTPVASSVFAHSGPEIFRFVPRSLRGPWGVDGCLWTSPRYFRERQLWIERPFPAPGFLKPGEKLKPFAGSSYQCLVQKVVLRDSEKVASFDDSGALLEFLWSHNSETKTSEWSRPTPRERWSDVLIYLPQLENSKHYGEYTLRSPEG